MALSTPQYSAGDVITMQLMVREKVRERGRESVRERKGGEQAGRGEKEGKRGSRMEGSRQAIGSGMESSEGAWLVWLFLFPLCRVPLKLSLGLIGVLQTQLSL